MRELRSLSMTVLLLSALAGCRSATPPDTSGSAAARSAEPMQQAGERAHGRRGARGIQEAQPGSFDFYLLNLSWDPEYCATHAGAAECAAHKGFVVHGLWPQNNDGTFPENCSDAPGPANPGQYLDLQPTVSLVMHEWATHGTCSGLAPDAYFQTIRTVFHQVAIPADLQPGGRTPGALTPAALVAQFAGANPAYPQGSFALSCGNNQLTAIEACFTRGLQPEPCQAVKSCRANVVKITPP